MIGSFIGTFAVGLISAHVYYSGREGLDKLYDSLVDCFRLTPEDEERMKLSPEEEAEALEWGGRNPKKKDAEEERPRRAKVKAKPRRRPKPSGRRKGRKPANKK